jgi:hypothetical protein
MGIGCPQPHGSETQEKVHEYLDFYLIAYEDFAM